MDLRKQVETPYTRGECETCGDTFDSSNASAVAAVHAKAAGHRTTTIVTLRITNYGDELDVPPRLGVTGILDYIKSHPGCTSSEIRKEVRGNASSIFEALASLTEEGKIFFERGRKNSKLYTYCGVSA